jgi:regulator of replication initiation timing
MGSPLARGSSVGGGGGGATAANASDLLLSFLTQTVREMKEKITSLEDDNQHLRTKHRKLKRRLKDNDERVEQLFSTVANLAQAQAPHPQQQQQQQQQQQRVQTMPTARSNFYASTLSSSSSTMQPSSTSPPSSSSSSPTSSSASSSSSSSYDSYYAYPLPTATTSTTSRLALSRQPHQQMPLQDFLDRSLATENAASAVSYGSGGGGGGGGQSTSALHNHQRATLLQQYQHQRQQMHQQQQHQQLYPGAGDQSSTISGYAAPPVFSMTAGFQQQQQKQQQQPAAAAAAAAMRMMMEPSPVCGAPGLGVPSYTINSVSDIKRHFPYFDECYFDKTHFVVNDLRFVFPLPHASYDMCCSPTHCYVHITAHAPPHTHHRTCAHRKPYLVMQFVSMDSTVVTASDAYCSLSGFTLVRTSSTLWH